MKTLIVAAIRCFLMFFVPTFGYAISAQWDLDPVSSDWNIGANWTPDSVPNGPADIATFRLSNTTDVSISADTEVNTIRFATGASAYTITASPGVTLTISGAGIVNNSGATQNFVTIEDAIGSIEYRGKIFFINSATAGNSTVFTNHGGVGFNQIGGSTEFFDMSSAANGIFINNAGAANAAQGGFTEFHNNSTAANGNFTNNGGFGISPNSFGGTTIFLDTSTAGNGTFVNNGGPIVPGGTLFFHNSSAGNGAFTNNGAAAVGAASSLTYVDFSATAANGTFINNAGLVSGAAGGKTEIVGTAANGTFINNGATVGGAKGGQTQIFYGNAANGTFTNNGSVVSGGGGGFTEFAGTSTAAFATLIANGGSNGGEGGTILFAGQSTAASAQIEVFGNGSLDISRHDGPGMTINSIAGDGNVFLGANNLTVGSDDEDATFACTIQDGSITGGVGGSLTKIGSGTLVLSGANTYTGNTNVNGGVLQVDGSIVSNTFVRHAGTLAGNGAINSDLRNGVGGAVSPGTLGGPGLLTVVHSYTQAQYATLMIQIAGANPGEFSVLNVLGTANLNGLLDPVLLNGFVPSIGDSFVFLNYASFTGAFTHIKHQVFDNGMLQWSVVYEGNHAILTVGPNTIPDQGSTFLLLSLGLLGLAMFRRQFLLRRQS
jgi:autotransporter-associated beta strand protein